MSTLSTETRFRPPDHWSPEQALIVYDLLTEITEAIWNRYEIPLIELIGTDQGDRREDTAQLDLFDFDDPLPF